MLGSVIIAGPPATADQPSEAPSKQEFSARDGWKPLFDGKSLTGWTFRNPRAKDVWVVCTEVAIDPTDPARLTPRGDGGSAGSVLLCGDDGRGSDIMTRELFTDYQLHIEFTVPKGSNSGVYNRGLFEIQD